jgi:hypothetical protein
MSGKQDLTRYLVGSGVPQLTCLMENFMKKLVNDDQINARRDIQSNSLEFSGDFIE